MSLADDPTALRHVEPVAETPRRALELGQTWWADCPDCRCSGKVDLQGLVEAGRGQIGQGGLRCPRCKGNELSIRVRDRG